MNKTREKRKYLVIDAKLVAINNKTVDNRYFAEATKQNHFLSPIAIIQKEKCIFDF